MRDQCSGFTKEGRQCSRSVEGPYNFCWLHDPTRAEDRRRAASKAGSSKPNREIVDIKGRLSDLADDVLKGVVDKGKGAVVSQILNVYLRAISVELQAREQIELEERMREIEEHIGQSKPSGRAVSPWG